jgi:hypothetical protein
MLCKMPTRDQLAGKTKQSATSIAFETFIKRPPLVCLVDDCANVLTVILSFSYAYHMLECRFARNLSFLNNFFSP